MYQRAALTLTPALVVIMLSQVSASGTIPNFSLVSSPNHGSGSNELLGVSGLSGGDVWSVGDFVAGPYVNSLRTLAEHWDGAAWRIVSTSDPATADGDYDSLQAVAAVSSSDAWAVGYSGNVSVAADKALIEHWNGTRWRAVPAPNPYTTQRLYGVAALSSSNVWAVGEEFNQDPYGYGALIEHWNGTRWKAVPNPATRTMYGITANSPTDVWAAGETQILHWDGSAWGVVQSPQPQGGGDYQLRAVAAASADDIWAAGYALVPSGEGYAYQNLIEHWNGASWGLASGVGLNPGSDLLFGISAASPTRVWAVGTSGGHSFVERWDGATWAHVASPNRGTSNNTLRSIAAIRDTGDVWTVGQFYRAVSPYQSRTLVETCSACGS